ncbi:MAG: response regulator, partial [candidate division Zixibacteria bacterium]|nr:response regulator [candidate division Zixibacteria bacterium]
MSDESQHKHRVLVVDDEDIVQSLVRDALEDDGFYVETVSGGHEAIERLVSTSFDLMVTDIRMPGMDGVELVERARDLAPNMGVVYMTGYANLNSAKDAIKQGALDYIMKPFELNEMRQAIRGAVAKLDEAASSDTDQQLSSLSDLSHVLFAAGDRTSLVMSSLKFAMMHMQSPAGSVLFLNTESGQFEMKSIVDGQSSEQVIGAEPLESVLRKAPTGKLGDPVLLSCLEEHPLYRLWPDPELAAYLLPPWFDHDNRMIYVPVNRAEDFYGMIMLGFADDTVKVKQSDLTFLSITASQLAVNLENLTLLDNTQTAYARLKELQDETIELEKMATRGEMSAEIGHELNNFLGVVAGNISLLDVHLKRADYGELDRYVSATISTIEKIKKFTANLMDLGAIASQREVLEFDRLLTEVVEYLGPQKRFRDLTINIPAFEHSVPFLADSTQIQQLLYNLFNNAADATTGCDVREITVGLDTCLETASFRVTITDTGVGIDGELLAKA